MVSRGRGEVNFACCGSTPRGQLARLPLQSLRPEMDEATEVRCVVVTVELRFDHDIPIFASPQKLLTRALRGEDAAEAEETVTSVEQRLVFQLRDIHARVITEAKLLAIIQQGSESPDRFRSDIMHTYRRVREFVQSQQLTRISVRSHWISPSELEFAALVASYREAMYKPGPFTAQGNDLAVIVDGETSGGRTFSLQSGPMERAQLVRQYLLADDLDETPARMIFLDVDYGHTSAAQENRAVVDRFIKDALEFAAEQARLVEQQFEGAIP